MRAFDGPLFSCENQVFVFLLLSIVRDSAENSIHAWLYQLDFLHNHITLGIETKKLLDKLRQPPYHETEGIQLSSSVQIKQQENNVVGVLFLIFCTMCTLCLHNISGFLPI